MYRRALILCVLALNFPLEAALSPEAVEFFENKIRPVLAQDCYECHRTGGKKKGGLLLDSRDGLLRGGNTGAAIVPGKPEESLLIKVIRHEVEDMEMPKAGAKLEASVIADFEKWVKMGAPDPRDTPAPEQQVTNDTSWPAVMNRRKQWWSFQPIKKPELPANAATHPIDKFIRARLEKEKLAPAGKADRDVLVRRLSFALRGLPPTIAELRGSQSIEAVVESYLKSPQFGERWARHWMDWYRYADSHGSEGDATIPFSWQYRDYLIRALNDDVPYGQLLREHVAGDLLKSPRLNRELGLNESALGIGHLRMVFHGYAPTDALEEKVRFVDDEIAVVSKAALGLTVSCARCHDHKFDPISQADYTAWFGIFASGTPATIGVEAPNESARRELASLKKEVKAALIREWLKDLEDKTVTNSSTTAEVKFAKRWNLAEKEALGEWNRNGAARWTEAGDFVLAPNGDSIVSAILPSGVISADASTKDRAVLVSPKHRLKGKFDLWVRATGEGGSVLRYVVENYPRDGSIYPVSRLNGGEWRWVKHPLDYWEGDRVHVEISTAADQAVLGDANATRSWFAIRDVLFVPQGEAGPKNLTNEYSGTLREALAAWERNELTDEAAIFLDQAARRGALKNKLADLEGASAAVMKWREAEAKLPGPVRAPGVIETDDGDQPLFVRGNHKQPADVVERRFLEAIDAKPYAKINARAQLAEDLVRAENPLTSRVIVNRVWHHLFGRGIVGTPDNFGRLGQQPSHPELLDFLAAWFVENGSSIKQLIRFIVMSETWQAVSETTPASMEKDPENVLLSHFSVRRLEAEAIRDSLLAISGELKTEAMFGPPISTKTPRRSVYLRVKRNDLDPFMSAFDAPAPASTTGKRDVTNVPGQSLLLLNDPFVMQLAESWSHKNDGDVTNRIVRMFEEALGRAPSQAEIEKCVAMLEVFRNSREGLTSERAQAAERITGEQNKLEKLKMTVKGRALANRPEKPAGPEAIAVWNAKNGFGELKGNARVENDELILDGKAHAATEPLKVSLKAKTLEAWVRLAALDQQGGGAFTIQSLDGEVFDSIVIGEQESRRWISGSDFFRRTKGFAGSAETETGYVHMTITYADDGTVTAYRNGEPYGKAYKIEGPAEFEAGKARALFGLRHGEPGGNRMLSGAIRKAALYDRALSAEEVRAAFKGDPTFVSRGDLLAAMTGEERLEFERLEKSIGDLQNGTREMDRRRGLKSEWADLAHAIFNLKEFVYVR